MHKDDSPQLGGPLKDGIVDGKTANAVHARQLHADHRAVRDPAVQLVDVGLYGVFPQRQPDEPEQLVRIALQGLQYVPFGHRLADSQKHAETLDPHATGYLEQVFDLLLEGPARDAVPIGVAMQVPDSHSVGARTGQRSARFRLDYRKKLPPTALSQGQHCSAAGGRG